MDVWSVGRYGAFHVGLRDRSLKSDRLGQQSEGVRCELSCLHDIQSTGPKRARNRTGTGWLFAVLTFFPQDALAYLDGGTGSMILQIMLSGLAGLAVAGKLFWSQIKNFFMRFLGKRG